MNNQLCEFSVIGSGLTGQLAALALAMGGHKVCRIAPAVNPEHDRRTTALLANSVMFLESLGVWDKLSQHAAPLKKMRIVDATKRLFRAQQADFSAMEINLAVFGYNIENRHLSKILEIASTKLVNLQQIHERVVNLEKKHDCVSLKTNSGKIIDAQYLVAADGKNSLVRRWTGITTKQRVYPQTVIALNFSHEYPHMDTSTEFHTESGPFTQVPLIGNHSSLVWVVHPDQVSKILAADRAELSHRIEAQMGSLLGKVNVEGKIQSFPVSSLIAKRFSLERVFLVGESGHQLPPIAAQGLNIGISDVKTLVELAQFPDRKPDFMTQHYNSIRSRDICQRTAATNWLNQSLISNFLPTHFLYGVGLHLFSSIGPARRLLMRWGVGIG